LEKLIKIEMNLFDIQQNGRQNDSINDYYIY
jgi:hypothetical protein